VRGIYASGGSLVPGDRPWGSVDRVAVFFAAGGEEDAAGKNRDEDGDDEERGSDVHA